MITGTNTAELSFSAKKDLEGHSVLMCFDKGCRSSEVSTTEGAFEVNLAIFIVSWGLQDQSIGAGEQESEPWYAGNGGMNIVADYIYPYASTTFEQ